MLPAATPPRLPLLLRRRQQQERLLLLRSLLTARHVCGSADPSPLLLPQLVLLLLLLLRRLPRLLLPALRARCPRPPHQQQRPWRLPCPPCLAAWSRVCRHHRPSAQLAPAWWASALAACAPPLAAAVGTWAHPHHPAAPPPPVNGGDRCASCYDDRECRRRKAAGRVCVPQHPSRPWSRSGGHAVPCPAPASRCAAGAGAAARSGPPPAATAVPGWRVVRRTGAPATPAAGEGGGEAGARRSPPLGARGGGGGSAAGRPRGMPSERQAGLRHPGQATTRECAHRAPNKQGCRTQGTRKRAPNKRAWWSSVRVASRQPASAAAPGGDQATARTMAPQQLPSKRILRSLQAVNSRLGLAWGWAGLQPGWVTRPACCMRCSTKALGPPRSAGLRMDTL